MPRPAPVNRREDILAAATEEFAANGFAAARMEDIARRLGISKAALYLQFDTKEALFRALIESLVTDTLPQVLPRMGPETSAAEVLKIFIPAAIRQIAGGEVAFVPRLIIGEGNRFPELTRYYHDVAVSRVLGLVEQLIRHGIERGEFRAVDAHHAARSVAGGVIISALWRTVFEPVGAEPLDLEAMAAAHLDLVLGGLSAKGGGQ
jgi:AcrR family transcriptional regulator